MKIKNILLIIFGIFLASIIIALTTGKTVMYQLGYFLGTVYGTIANYSLEIFLAILLIICWILIKKYKKKK
jgi:hypothetical protein